MPPCHTHSVRHSPVILSPLVYNCSSEMHIQPLFQSPSCPGSGRSQLSQLPPVAALCPGLKPEPVKALWSLDLLCERETECKRLENKPIFPVNACWRVWFCLAGGYDGVIWHEHTEWGSVLQFHQALLLMREFMGTCPKSPPCQQMTAARRGAAPAMFNDSSKQKAVGNVIECSCGLAGEWHGAFNQIKVETGHCDLIVSKKK